MTQICVGDRNTIWLCLNDDLSGQWFVPFVYLVPLCKPGLICRSKGPTKQNSMKLPRNLEFSFRRFLFTIIVGNIAPRLLVFLLWLLLSFLKVQPVKSVIVGVVYHKSSQIKKVTDNFQANSTQFQGSLDGPSLFNAAFCHTSYGYMLDSLTGSTQILAVSDRR